MNQAPKSNNDLIHKDFSPPDALVGKGLTYALLTYGCAMNEHDSETISGILEQLGYTKAEPETADLILFNTCCVRENAETKLFGNVGALKSRKANNKNLIIGVCGCMMQQEGAAKELQRRFPFVDLVFGTHNLHNLPELIAKALHHQQTLEVFDVDGYIIEGLPVRRGNDFSAFLNIMYGCNNFCSYCIVPYVRGRERSRHSQSILAEAEQAALGGATQITLLGQNVNSYNRGSPDLSFPDLLRELDNIPGLRRIRFLTSHPQDISNDLIDALAGGEHLCPQLHLPIQSGDNDVLAAMNRGYTVEHYLERLDQIRSKIPGVGITTDIIVGFPGETQQQFEHTLDLLEHAQFDGVFSLIYSPRPGTQAAGRADQLSRAEKSRRLQELIARQSAINSQKHRMLVGKAFTVLVEKAAKREGQMQGRSPQGFLINFPGKVDLIGSYVEVKITQGLRNSLRGERL